MIAASDHSSTEIRDRQTNIENGQDFGIPGSSRVRRGARWRALPFAAALAIPTLAHAVEPDLDSDLGALEEAAETFGEWAFAAWRAELFQLGSQSVTIGLVVVALALFTLGFSASRWLSGLLGNFLTRRLSVEQGAAHAIQGLAYYFLLAIFTFSALRLLNIPLTAFTVAGGAIAIGVGFGSQNIVNNFISGLVLMLERPIKVGDIIDVDGTFGRVQNIGARSTRIRTFDNIHIVVPNSSFLEKNVINWTHTDDVVRTSVDIGVAYGSPTREVDRLICRVLAEHGQILDKPPPTVLFTEFGDNALNFRAYFWLKIPEMMDRRRVESDVRYRIDSFFREAGIEIAFPQRDVHLDVAAALPVRLVTEEPPEEGK
jgi:small-conductance mechanosensitive channel